MGAGLAQTKTSVASIFEARRVPNVLIQLGGQSSMSPTYKPVLESTTGNAREDKN